MRAEAPTVEFLGLDFHELAPAGALDAVARRPATEPFAFVVTPNVDHVVRLHRSRPELWPIYRRAWLTLCDSRILSRLAALASLRLPVVTGSDLTAELLGRVVRPGDRIAVLGASAATVEAVRARYGLVDLVHHDPPMGFIHDPAARARAAAFLVGAQARFSLIAVGSPQQEMLADEVARSGRATGLGLCVGASLEFLAGSKARAPLVVQRLALEWLFRLLSEPRRLWRRYLVDGPWVFALFRRWRAARAA